MSQRGYTILQWRYVMLQRGYAILQKGYVMFSKESVQQTVFFETIFYTANKKLRFLFFNLKPGTVLEEDKLSISQVTRYFQFLFKINHHRTIVISG